MVREVGVALRRGRFQTFTLMTNLAESPLGRVALHCLARTLRPFRFALGIAKRVPRPLAELLTL